MAANEEADLNKQTISQLRVSWLEVLKSLTGGTVFIAATLYALGFIIWNAALGRFGVSLGAAIRVDYISAALCYVVFVASVAVPVWIVLRIFESSTGRATDAESAPFWAAVVLWNLTIGRIRTLYLSTPHKDLLSIPRSISQAFWWKLALVTVLLVHVAVAVFLRKRPFKFWKINVEPRFRLRHLILY